MNSSVIQVSNLTTAFGDHVVHDRISFSVNRGEIVSVIGGSGTGKTVLMKQVMTLWQDYTGSIKLFENELRECNADELMKIREEIGVVFQNAALFSSLTTGENIALPFREHTNLKREEVESLIPFRLSMVGLKAEDAQKVPSSLSGGMKKRVALARALALDPALLFLDEPTSGLDPVLAREMDRLIQRIAKSLNLTVVNVTHDTNTVCDISDRVVVLGEGKVLADGPVDEVQKTDNEWIQSFFANSAKALR